MPAPDPNVIEGQCHCGAVSFRLEGRPRWLTECNCSLCRRIGARWAHASISAIAINAEPGATLTYIQGDRTLAVHTCVKCGCTTHWEGVEPIELDRMAVNCRMADPGKLEGIPVRRFDGADTWRFIDPEPDA